MKKVLLGLCLLFTTIINGQTIYSWTSSVDPGWVSTNVGSGSNLKWSTGGGCGVGVVTTNCGSNYSNNQNTTYTSSSINAVCDNASTINVSFDVIGRAEYEDDFLFLEYSINGGTTWVNPYGVGYGWTGNFSSLTNVSNILPSSNNFRFRFTFTSDNNNNYSGYKISNFTITCNSALPVELISFTGRKTNDYNVLEWNTASEHNSSHFVLERSTSHEFIEKDVLTTMNGSGNSQQEINYSYIDNSPPKSINYYRLTQYDFDGKFEIFDIIYVDNTEKNKKVVKIVNTLGQDVNEYTNGVVFEVYEDGSMKKIWRP